MKRRPGHVFLQRRTYRRRRLTDAARLLPIFGAVLLAIPLLWTGTPEAPTRTSSVMLYVFIVWIALTGVSALISRDIADHSQDGSDTDAKDDPGEPPETP